jgi:hypothetical protein
LNRVLHLCPGRQGPQSSYLHFLYKWDDRHMPPYTACVGWDGSCDLFAWLALNGDPTRSPFSE